MRISVWQWRRSPSVFPQSSLSPFAPFTDATTRTSSVAREEAIRPQRLQTRSSAQKITKCARYWVVRGLPKKVTSSITGFRMFAVPRATSGKNLPGLAGVEGGRGKAIRSGGAINLTS